jgi:hypothetical protein
MTDRLTVDIDRAIMFRTLAGDELAAHGVQLVLTGPPASAKLTFRVAHDVYERILQESLFGLGEAPMELAGEVEIVARMRPDVANALTTRGGGARELIEGLEGGTSIVGMTETWQALEARHDEAGGKLGYTIEEGAPMLEVAREAANRAGTPLEDAGDGLYRFEAEASTVLVWIDEDTRICAVYSVGPQVPPDRRADVAQYLVERNYYLNVGAFEMDLDDGEIRLRTSIDATHATFDAAVFVNLVASNLRLFALHEPILRALCDGTLSLAEARLK